jgi:hypothetical protein
MKTIIESKISVTISSFLKLQRRVKRAGNPRWQSSDGFLFYEWDSLHGEIEVYDSRGNHYGVLNADGTPSKKLAIKGRKIDV